MRVCFRIAVSWKVFAAGSNAIGLKYFYHLAAEKRNALRTFSERPCRDNRIFGISVYVQNRSKDCIFTCISCLNSNRLKDSFSRLFQLLNFEF